MYFVGRGPSGLLFEGRLSFTFWAFRDGAYSKWVLIRKWAVYRINMANCQEGFLECKSIGAMPVKEYSCTINLGFLLKRVTARSFTFRKGPRIPAFKFSHLHGGMVDGIIYNNMTIS